MNRWKFPCIVALILCLVLVFAWALEVRAEVLNWKNPTTYTDGSTLDIAAINSSGKEWFLTRIYQGATSTGPWTRSLNPNGSLAKAEGAGSSYDITHLLLPAGQTRCWTVKTVILDITAANLPDLESAYSPGICYTTPGAPPPPPPPPPPPTPTRKTASIATNLQIVKN